MPGLEEECSLYCDRCGELKARVYRVPTENEGVFVHRTEFIKPPAYYLSGFCPDCDRPLKRVE